MLPHDHEAERAVLGALLLDNNRMAEVGALLSGADFYQPGHGRIFEAIRTLVNEGRPADELTVIELARDRSPDAMQYLASLTEQVPTAANASSYAKIVRERSTQRKLINIGHDLQTLAQTESSGEAIERTTKRLFELHRGQQERRVVKAKDAAREAMKRIEAAYKNPGAITGAVSGLTELDEMLSGFQDGDLVVLGARPSMGKSALALNFVLGAAMKQKKRGLIFALEMSAVSLATRAIAELGRVSMTRMKRGGLTESDFARIARGANDFASSDVVIDETSMASIADVRSVCRQVAMDGGLGLVVVDYLQLMHAPGIDSREQQISSISRGLKQLAGELKVPILALSQLNRGLEQRKDKRPIMSDLRESGAIEQDADVIMFLYRDEVYEPETEDRGIAEIIVGKQRNGPTGTVKARFDPDIQKFDNLDSRHG